MAVISPLKRYFHVEAGQAFDPTLFSASHGSYRRSATARPGDFLTAPTVIQQHQGIGAARQTRRCRPIARQRNQLAAILFAEKAAPNHASIGIRQAANCKEFLPRLH
jgi:hypothetical protein